MNNLKRYEEEGSFEFIISSFLEEYVHLFNDKQIKSNIDNQFGKISLINRTLQSCYLDDSETESFGINANVFPQHNGKKQMLNSFYETFDLCVL